MPRRCKSLAPLSGGGILLCVNRALIIAVIIIVFGGGYTIFKVVERNHERSAAATTPSASIEFTNVATHEEGDTYSSTVAYPQFGIPAIDSQIRQKVEDAAEEVKGYPALPEGSATFKNSFDASFDRTYVGPDVISVEMILSQYSGGAHPMTILSGLNFDRETGKQLLQDDAFRMVGLSVDQISKRASAQLKSELGDAFSFPEGASSNPENFSSFLVGTSTVTFLFQPYQVAPYSEGPQQVSFPRK